MSATYGIFVSGEGEAETGFCSEAEAVARMASEPDYAEDCYVAECCHDHPDQPKDGCEQCPADDAEDESDE